MPNFCEYLYKPRSWKTDRKFFKTIEYYRKLVPDYHVMKDIVIALQELELVFMYDNSMNSTIYSLNTSKTKSSNSMGFVIDNDDLKLTISLDHLADDGDIISIVLNRKKGTKIETKMRFRDGEGDEYIVTKKDEMIFAIIEDLIMTTFCDLLEWYYQFGPQRNISQHLLPSS